MTTVNDLINVLTLKKVGDNEFNGISKTVGSPNVFGGQVLAQAINAACRTITNGRILHSMHSYFLEAGNLDLPITYNVSIVRDGGSFSVRRVTAHQKETTIFILSASFHKKEDGYNHQIDMNNGIKQPEELLSWTDMLEQFGDVMPPRTKEFLTIDRPVEFKPVEVVNPYNKEDLPPFSNVWIKLKGESNQLDLATKQQMKGEEAPKEVVKEEPKKDEVIKGSVKLQGLKQVGKIEIEKKELDQLSDKTKLKEITSKLEQIGFKSILIDPEGYKSGKLNVIAD